MTTNQPESINERLSRLETIFADMGDVVVAQNEAIASNKQSIDALTANINRLAEQSHAFAEQTNQNLNLLAQQAERDRQVFQTEIQRIWEYLLQQGGNGRQA